jgi:hypothetical protein
MTIKAKHTICEFVFPACTPIQYRYADALALTIAWYTWLAHVQPSPAPPYEYHADVHAPCTAAASVCHTRWGVFMGLVGWEVSGGVVLVGCLSWGVEVVSVGRM